MGDHPDLSQVELISDALYGGSGNYNVDVANGGVFVEGERGTVNCGGEGNFNHEGDGNFATSGYGLFMIEGEGQHYIYTDMFGTKESTWGSFQLFSDSPGYYNVQVSDGWYKITTSGTKYTCFGTSESSFHLYAQGKSIQASGTGANHEAHKWTRSDDDEDPDEDRYVYRRQAPIMGLDQRTRRSVIEEEKSAYVKFFETIEDIVILAANGKALTQVLTSVELLSILGKYDNARVFCDNYEKSYDYYMCTMTDTDAQETIFSLLDTVWLHNNAMMLSSISEMMTDYDSIKFVVDTENTLNVNSICDMSDDPYWRDANGNTIPETIHELCSDDHRSSVPNSVKMVRTMGKSVSAMGPMLCPALSDIEILEPLLKDSFNDSMLDIVRDVMDNEMTCMSDSFDIKDLFDVEKLLSDYEFRDFVCGDPDHDDDEDEDGFEMISRLIIIILLIVILVVLLIVLYVQFRIIRQVNKNTHSAPRVFHNITNDVNKPESVKKQRPEISGVNPANFGFYTSSVPGGPVTYPQNEGQVNFGF